MSEHIDENERRIAAGIQIEPIAENLALGPQWIGLAHATEFILADAKKRGSCLLQTYSHKFGLSPYSSPYMQASWDGNVLHVELSGNIICDPPLSEKQLGELEKFGWEPPNEECPNFEKVWTSPNLAEVAEYVLTSMVAIMGIEEQDFFAFGNAGNANSVDELNKLDRLARTKGNEGREIFCLKGQHKELL
jgi:hypothetical protein